MNEIEKNFVAIKADIKRDACKHSRNVSDINLVAVSKKQPDERIDEALSTGQLLFGENRVQEAQEHWLERKANNGDIKLHLIGPLQTNKAKDAVALFDCIETIDRKKLVDTLIKEMNRQNRHFPCFIQVNTGAEEQKSGVLPAALPDLLAYCADKGLKITGLMCIPPFNEPSALHFALLKKLAQRHDLEYLSMGMSADFEKAIALGATHIRVGTALFGERQGQGKMVTTRDDAA